MVRVSTGMIFDAGVSSMQMRTGSLLKTQQQISSGRRILSPSDDPVAAARALDVTQAKSINAGQAEVRNNARSTIGLADSQLESVSSLLIRVRELAVQAGNGALSSNDRSSLAAELRSRFDELVALANSTDGTGQHLFGGYQSSSRPFAGSVANGVSYGGDDGMRTLKVSDSRLLPISDSGNDVFMRIQNGNGVFATSTRDALPGNIRTAAIDLGTVNDKVVWAQAPANMALSFFADADGTTYYDLVDTATGLSAFTGTTSAPATHGALTGSANLLAAPTVVTGANNVLSLTVDGTLRTVTVPVGTYTRDGLVKQLQALYDAIPAGVTVSAGGNGLAFTSNSYGAASAVITPAGTAAATLVGGTPGVVPGTAGTHTNLFVSGQEIPLSSLVAPFDFGASVKVTGNPISGDRFAITRDSSGAIATSPAAITHGMAAIIKGSVSNPLKWTTAANSQNLELRFQTNAAGKTFYDLVDVTNGKSLYSGTTSLPASAGSLVANADLSAGVTITGANDALDIDVDGATLSVTIPPGTYTQAGVVAEVQRQLDALAPAGVKVVVSSSGNALKFSSATLGATSTVLNPAGTAAATLIGGGPYGTATGVAGTYAQPYTSGTAINLLSTGVPPFDFGAVVTVAGNPADGDAFTIKGSSDTLTGNGFFVTAPKTTATVNAGSGVIGAGEIRDQSRWNNPLNSRNHEVRFWSDPAVSGSLYYDLVDRETERSLFTNSISSAGGGNNTFTHAFNSGESIAFAGLSSAYSQDGAIGDFGVAVTINGTPASGDAFGVTASTSKSVFDTLARLVTTLESGTLGGQGDTQLHNQLGSVLTDLSRAEDNILRIRSQMGSRLSEVDNLDSIGENLNLQYEETLSRLQDLDYAKAITELTRQKMELEAAQKSFVQVSGLSLFDYI